MKINFKFCLAFIIISLFGCNTKNTQENTHTYQNAVIVSARAEASKIGLELIKNKGGNAFDAMVATEFALSIAYPFSGSIGGGGFAVFRLANGTSGTIDYREKAPLKADKDMYLDDKGNVIEGRSLLGATATGVPGMVKGLIQIHQKYGKLPLDEVLKPVIAFAKKGYVVTQKQAKRFEKYRFEIVKVSGENTLYSKKYIAGDTIKNIALAKTISKISETKGKSFYHGDIAKKFAQFVHDKGGIISTKDLEKYNAIWRAPITFDYKNLSIISMSPPSSGGVCLAQIMKMIAPYPLKGHHSAATIQTIVEACRRAYADRSFYLGDPDFVNNQLDKILDDNYLKNRMQNFSLDKASTSASINHGNITSVESNETTHYSIVDHQGNAISVTTTLNGAYGSKLYCEELGFFLNNEMDDFSIKPGYPNMFGLVGSKANSIAPEKRMLSSMTPTIIEEDNKLRMVVGSPGGSTIITSVLQTILNVYEFGMTMQEAVDTSRFHHQWLPDYILVEPDNFNTQTLDSLQNKGYKIKQTNSVIIGKVDAILVHPDGKLEAGADYRGDDTAVGF